VRYLLKNNFVKKDIYGDIEECFLRRKKAEMLC